MYGLLNKALGDLITERYGAEKWYAIKQKSEIETEFFISNVIYDDEITLRLADSASELLGLTKKDIMFEFGEWWVLRTGKEKFGNLMKIGSSTFQEFMINLPMFQNRVTMMYPELTSSEFVLYKKGPNCVVVQYNSKGEGFPDFIKGLLTGIGKMYGIPLNIETSESIVKGNHEVYNISW